MIKHIHLQAPSDSGDDGSIEGSADGDIEGGVG
ncbi:hypothetical protein LINGRAHAP2_LOCUS22117, partial [Linum grandiflorum]